MQKVESYEMRTILYKSIAFLCGYGRMVLETNKPQLKTSTTVYSAVIKSGKSANPARVASSRLNVARWNGNKKGNAMDKQTVFEILLIGFTIGVFVTIMIYKYC